MFLTSLPLRRAGMFPKGGPGSGSVWAARRPQRLLASQALPRQRGAPGGQTDPGQRQIRGTKGKWEPTAWRSRGYRHTEPCSRRNQVSESVEDNKIIQDSREQGLNLKEKARPNAHVQGGGRG